MQDKKSKRKEIMDLLTEYSTIGMTVAFSIVIGLAIGYFLDHKVFGGRYVPKLTLVGLAFGIGAAFKNLYDLAIRKEFQDDDRKPKGE